MSVSVPLLLAPIVAYVIALGLTPVVMRAAHHYGFIAKPKADRWHRRPTALLGGIAIAAALTLPLPFFLPLRSEVLGLWLTTLFVFGLGLWDDIRPLRPYVKLLGQIVAACALIVSDIRIEIIEQRIVADVLTIIWVVGLTNAFNLLDNMDGLAAGIALLTALALAAFSVSFGDPRVALLCFLLAGACAGFLVYNFNPARIFMGDSGSLTLGFFLSAVALLGTSTMAGGVVLTLAVPVLVMALPILDTTLVTIVRILHGRSPAQGGRDHLSHRLVALGLSERQAVVMLYVLSAAFGVLAFVANVVDLWLAAALGALGLIAVVLFAIFLAHVRVYTDAEYRQAPAPPDRATVVGGVLMFKRQVFELLLDFNLVCVAYLGAYLLKFEGTLSGLFLVQFSQSLPYVIAVKLTALLAFGVYRAVWRYLSLPDLLTLAKASTAGTLGSMLIVWVVFRFELFSRSVFVIDWLLLTTLLVASRLSFRGLRDWFARLPRAQATRALIAGAGDEAELTLRTLLRDPNRSIEPVGLLDDDQAKLNRRIHGVPVLGRLGDLEKLATEHRVEVLVIALSGEQEVTTAELIGSCERLDLDYRLVRSPFA